MSDWMRWVLDWGWATGLAIAGTLILYELLEVILAQFIPSIAARRAKRQVIVKAAQVKAGVSDKKQSQRWDDEGDVFNDMFKDSPARGTWDRSSAYYDHSRDDD